MTTRTPATIGIIPATPNLIPRVQRQSRLARILHLPQPIVRVIHVTDHMDKGTIYQIR
jgi:hypothetical protein